MAVSITQQPTTPNFSNTKLLYILSGSGTTGNPQYSYVLDVYYSGSSDLISRITQVPNQEGVAEFNLGPLLNDKTARLERRYGTNGNYLSIDFSGSKFEIYYGEQYGTSTSSSVSTYLESTPLEIQLHGGTLDPNTSNYNFNSGSQVQLTNQTTASLADGYYCSLGIFAGGTPGQGFSPLDYRIRIYDVNFNELESSVIGGGIYGNVYDVGINYGFQDLRDYPTWEYIQISPQPGQILPNFGIWYKRVHPCNDGITHFIYRNPYGYWDYYSLNTPLRRNSELQKDFFDLPIVDYSGTTSTYDLTRGGEKPYFTDSSDTYEITTPYLDQETATWLTDLLESEEVYIQKNAIENLDSGSLIVPVVIKNSTYTWNTNENRQKLFQYTITLSPAKGRDIFDIQNNVPTPAPVPPSSPTPTPSVTPTQTPTNTPTVTPTNTPTSSPTVTPTNTPTVTPTNSPTPTPSTSPLPPIDPPTISATLTDQQYHHSESINLAFTVYDPNTVKGPNTAIVEMGVFLGTDNSSAINNTKHVWTGSNKAGGAKLSVTQGGGGSVEQVDYSYYSAEDLTNQTFRSPDSLPGTASFCMITPDIDNPDDYVRVDNYTAIYGWSVTREDNACSLPLTASWETYGGLSPDTTYYWWAYASSSAGMVTSSMEEFTTFTNNVVAVRLQSFAKLASYSDFDCADCSPCDTFETSDALGDWKPPTRTAYISMSNSTGSYPTDIGNEQVYSSALFGTGNYTNRLIYVPAHRTRDTRSWATIGPEYAWEYGYDIKFAKDFYDDPPVDGVVNLQGMITYNDRLQNFGPNFFICSGSCC